MREPATTRDDVSRWTDAPLVTIWLRSVPGRRRCSTGTTTRRPTRRTAGTSTDIRVATYNGSRWVIVYTYRQFDRRLADEAHAGE
jgi:hypothetical protein